MGRLNKVKPVEVKVRLEDYVHLLLGEKKTGKTTLFRDLINKHYNGDMSKGFLAGFESGFNAMDGLYAEKIEDWSDWEDYVEEFVEDRKNIEFKLIGIDTIDYFVEMAISETLKASKRKDGKIVTSVNEAFGGFSRGKEYCLGIMRKSINALKNSGYGIVFIGHTKLKKKNTGLVLGDGQEYMQLSCNLTNDYAGLFEDMADMITYLVVNKQVTNVTDAKSRTATSSVNMVFRSDGSIDCGGRFKDLPEYLPYSADNYLKAFEQGVKGSMLQSKTDDEIKEMAKNQEKELEQKIEQKNKRLTIEEMVDEIKANFSKLGDGAKTRMAELLEKSGAGNINGLNESHRDIVEEMFELIK